MNKYLHIELGKAMSILGMCVALSSALIYDKKAVVLSVLGTYFNGIVLDHFIFGQNVKKTSLHYYKIRRRSPSVYLA